MARSIMIQGTMSNAGKSVLAAGLCRIFRQDGYSVAPFKSQNMALNSFITREGLEMGRAQVMQAEAAGVEPSVRMNPVLLKPTSDVGSQVIVNGEVVGSMSAAAYLSYKKQLIPTILESYHALAQTHDIVVLEGAGSPAEINLKAEDIVNMGMARMAGAPVLLAGDIDRGGVFAALYGTMALLEPDERAMVKGTIINKFRGDVEILRPGLTQLEELTHVPVVGVVPWMVPGGAEIALATSKLMEEYDAAVWAHHGLFVSGPDFDTAFGLMHTIEKAAAIYAEARMLNGGSDEFRNTITDDGLRAIARDFKLDINERFLD